MFLLIFYIFFLLSLEKKLPSLHIRRLDDTNYSPLINEFLINDINNVCNFINFFKIVNLLILIDFLNSIQLISISFSNLVTIENNV